MVNEKRQRDVSWYRRQHTRDMDTTTRYININNRLWNALKKLPGGLEAARRIQLENPRLP